MQTKDVIGKLRQIRRMKDVKQYELAKKAGFSHERISMWETGRNGITLDNLLILTEALGVKVKLEVIEEENLNE